MEEGKEAAAAKGGRGRPRQGRVEEGCRNPRCHAKNWPADVGLSQGVAKKVSKEPPNRPVGGYSMEGLPGGG